MMNHVAENEVLDKTNGNMLFPDQTFESNY